MIVGVALVALGVVALLTWLVVGGEGDASETAPSTTGASSGIAQLEEGTTAATTPTEGLGEGVADDLDGRTPLRGFGQVAATITAADGTTCEVCLLAAESEEQHARGLMEVTDEELGGYDGMVFIYPEGSSGSFWMRNTPMPLSIAYFDDAGALVSTADMAPCSNAPTCPSYPAAGPFALALEVPQGRLDDVGVVGDPGAVSIELTSRDCPLAEGA